MNGVGPASWLLMTTVVLSAWVALARRESLPASFRVKLADPQLFSALSKAFTGKPGVDRLTDQGRDHE